MPCLGPIERADLIRNLARNLARMGFAGPFQGGGHQMMVRGDVTVRVPNPHQDDISVDLLARVLRQAGILREEWESL